MLHQKSLLQKAESLSERTRRFYDFLQANPVGVLSTVAPSNFPHGSTIYFVIDTDCVVSFLTKTGTQKSANLKRNKHVMLTVFDTKTQTVVQLSGEADEVRDSVEVNGIAGAVLGASQKIGPGLPPISKLDGGAYTAYRIIPRQAHMAQYASHDPGNYDSIFDSIESFDLKADGAC